MGFYKGFSTSKIQLALSYVFFVAAFLIGIPLHECRKAGEYMALKLVVNEFVAYKQLSDFAVKDGHPGHLDPRSLLVLTFSNQTSFFCSMWVCKCCFCRHSDCLLGCDISNKKKRLGPTRNVCHDLGDCVYVAMCGSRWHSDLGKFK